jgi:hypothetical protein
VKLVRTLVADTIASDEVAAGVRDELAREGLLEAGEGYPRAEVEVLRADATSEGVAAAMGAPSARATDFAVIARAWVVSAPGASPEGDTGDLRGEQVVAIDETGPNGGAGAGVGFVPSGGAPGPAAAPRIDPRATIFHDADALRAAARRLGHVLARRLIGEPAASDDAVNSR